ncbi:16S rRNA (cytosine(1402)-N(4))-methyltransferase [bacterium]|nr:16S rRNA (cytosine(1402)-N(4))-methyltransferase [bacterium]
MKHIPVLLDEVVVECPSDTKGWLIDCTLGSGGHFLALLNLNDNLVGFDADFAPIENLSKILISKGFTEVESPLEDISIFTDSKSEKKVILCNVNFSKAKKTLEDLNIFNFSLILADLGLSTDQLLFSTRGFSFSQPNQALDMRINIKSGGPTAADLLNFLSESELTNLFRNYGEMSSAKPLAKKILQYREKFGNIGTVGELLKASGYQNRILGKKVHPATKLFMALRIAVNSEFVNLQLLLSDFLPSIYKGTKILIISFHSLEQKIIQNFVKDNDLNVKNIKPGIEEIRSNSSSRSATLNVIYE